MRQLGQVVLALFLLWGPTALSRGLLGGAGQAEGDPRDRGAPPLELPPILKGYDGVKFQTPAGGVYEVALNNYVIPGTTSYDSRSLWYDITEWAARQPYSEVRRYPASTVFMACAQNMPAFTEEAGVVPIAVANEFFGTPEKGATCGMCLRIYMPQHYPKCRNHTTNPFCDGEGQAPLIDNVNQTWAWNGKIEFDKDKQLHYFTGLIIEWFDREQRLPYALTMPTQGVDTDSFGDWPVRYKGVECPVGRHGIELQFLDFTKPVPVEQGICNNQLGESCGGKEIQDKVDPLGPLLKLLITSQRIPISAVSVYLSGKWVAFVRSGDGYWQYPEPRSRYRAPPVTAELKLEIACADGTAPRAFTVIPADMLCGYQVATCYGKEVPRVQC